VIDFAAIGDAARWRQPFSPVLIDNSPERELEDIQPADEPPDVAPASDESDAAEDSADGDCAWAASPC